MKYLLAFTLSVVLSLPCLAQSYLVYTVKGEVVSKDKAKAAPIRPGDQLTEKAVVSVSADGRLTVIDEKGETLFTLKEGIGTLSSLIENQQSKARPVTPSFLAFVREKISTKNNPKDVNYMQSAGVTYRGWGQHWIPLQAGTPGTLLDPLRESFALVRQAIADNDLDLLLSVSDRLDSLGLVRYDFPLVTAYTPQSFNGYFLFDPLCLVDLTANLDPSLPFADQIADMPVPMAPSTDNKLSGGNLLCNYYLLQPGQRLELAVECSGYCEIAALSLSGAVTASFDGNDSCFCTYPAETTAHIILTNHSETPEAVLFAINAE
ncbi:MAG: hypothetical protein IJP77_07870 [Bacteroidales bacterium]|nr:hypothetical protein [Bacteroidales bacterium]